MRINVQSILNKVCGLELIKDDSNLLFEHREMRSWN